MADPVPVTTEAADLPVSSAAVRRIARNTAIPAVTSLLNKALDFGFFIFIARQLSLEELGRYSWAVLTVGYLDILVNFGLGILLTRDLAGRPELAPRYLGGAMLLRLGLWILALVTSALVGGPLALVLGADSESAIALMLFTIGIGISNQFGLFSALFAARERMEYPAYVTTITTALKLAIGAGALFAGLGVVGLAGASIVVNVISGLVLLALYIRTVGAPRVEPSARVSLQLAADSYPLMLNNLLATFFFRVDGLLLKPMAGDAALAVYSAAYRFIDGLGIIPSNLVLAMFPALARAASAQGDEGRPNERLQAAAHHGLRVLLALAIPLSVGVMLLAEPVIATFIGPSFVPGAVIALQILVLLIPFSFTNGLLQYVLIAVDRKRLIMACFFGAAIFNVTANVLTIPIYGFVAAAVVTVASEVVLLVPFWWGVRRHVASVGWWPITWRPAVAAMLMAPVVWLLQPYAWLAVLVGAAMYAVALSLLGGIQASERRAVFAWLIGRLRRIGR